MNEMRKLMETVKHLDEANQGGKTEHCGAKKGKGAYYGRKKEAKRDSNKNRRRAGKEASLGENDEPGAKIYTRQYGNVTVKFDHDEVLITHGHGENIFLNMLEWKEFAGEIQDIFI